MLSLLKTLFSQKNEPKEIKEKTKIEDFFYCLNEAYRTGQPRFEFVVSDWTCKKDSDDFCRLYRCLTRVYDLKVDVKEKGRGKVANPREFLTVELSNIYIPKSKGFSFFEVEVPPQKKPVQPPAISSYNQTMAVAYQMPAPLPQIKQEKTQPEQVEGNVIFVDFKKKRK